MKQEELEKEMLPQEDVSESPAAATPEPITEEKVKDGDTESSEKASSDTLDRIWTDLLILMEKTKDWSDEDTTRDAIATKLTTNRTYLTKVVKDRTGDELHTVCQLKPYPQSHRDSV